MKKIEEMNASLTALILVCLMVSCSNSGEIGYRNREASVEDRVGDLLARMTIEEKVSQMRMFHHNQGIDFSDNGELELSAAVRATVGSRYRWDQEPG